MNASLLTEIVAEQRSWGQGFTFDVTFALLPLRTVGDESQTTRPEHQLSSSPFLFFLDQ